MGARESFKDELRRMGQQNGAWLDPNRLFPLIEDEIDDGATFVNVFHSLSNKREYLLVTSAASRFIDAGVFKMKVRWMVPHADLESVFSSRKAQGSYVRDLVVLQAHDRTYDFTMGFAEQASMGKVMRDMAEHNAEVAAEEINGCLRSRKSQPIDPGLAHYHRSIELGEAGPTPDTEPSGHWTGADYKRLFDWMSETFESGRRKAIWERRIALGYSFGQGPTSEEQWFWINALPALVALEIGQNEHPMTAVFAGYSDRAVNRSDPEQRSAMEQIEKQFFA